MVYITKYGHFIYNITAETGLFLYGNGISISFLGETEYDRAVCFKKENILIKGSL